MAGADVDVGTELRLGLPGGGADAAKAAKRGFEDTIDLKLKLPTAGMEEAAAAAAAKPEPAAEKAKRPAEAPAADAEKPPAPKYVYIDLRACGFVCMGYFRLKLTATSVSLPLLFNYRESTMLTFFFKKKLMITNVTANHEIPVSAIYDKRGYVFLPLFFYVWNKKK